MNQESDLIKTIIQGVKGAALKESLQQVHKREFGKSKKVRYLWAGSIAASISLFFLFMLSRADPITPSSLYVENYEPYPNIYSFRGEGHQEDYLQAALNYYAKPDFYQAVLLFDSAEMRQKLRPIDKDYLRFYKGLSYMGLEKYEKAISIFDSIQDHSKFENETRWYKGLCHLKLENIELMSSELIHLKSGDFKYEESRELLERLSSFKKSKQK